MAEPSAASDTTVARDLLRDGFDRIHDGVPAVVDGLTPEQLLWRPDPEANHLAWLVWHLSRQADAQLAALADREQAWTADGWAERFDLPYPTEAHGYAMSGDDVGAFVLDDPALLTGYADAVHSLTLEVIDALDPETLARVIDADWDPPVTVAVRVVSVLDDAAKHLGQAEYLRGLIERR